MARARGIKPGFYKNEDLAECSLWARFIFPGLWMLADREGRLEDRPRRIKGELLPFDSQDVEPLLDELHRHGFIVRYQNDEGSFIQISKFSAHQSPHYSEKRSEIKPPSVQEHSENEGLIKRGSQPPSSLTPDCGLPTPSSSTPDSRLLTADPGEKQHLPPGASPPVAKKSRANGEDQSPKSARTWEAYSAAYLDRWGADPVRNATVNAQLAGFVKRIGLAEAHDVAAFYVRSNRGLYVSAKHPVNLLLRDCEALRTEWATGRQGTDSEARQGDRTAAAGAVFSKLIAEASE